MNYAKAKQECTANHDVYMQCPYCGWERPSEVDIRANETLEEREARLSKCDHRFSVVVEWEPLRYESISNILGEESVDRHPVGEKATKLACEKCMVVKDI